MSTIAADEPGLKYPILYTRPATRDDSAVPVWVGSVAVNAVRESSEAAIVGMHAAPTMYR